MRGRKPKAPERQIADGDPSKRGTGKLEERLAREAKARHGLPDAPAHLDEVAREAWEFFSLELAHMDLDRRPDAKALEALCSAYSTALAADAEIRRDGVMVDNVRMTSKGDVVVLGKKPNPASALSFRAWNLFRQYATEFGFTPISRGRLSLDKQPKGTADDLRTLLAGPRVKREATVQ